MFWCHNNTTYISTKNIFLLNNNTAYTKQCVFNVCFNFLILTPSIDKQNFVKLVTIGVHHIHMYNYFYWFVCYFSSNIFIGSYNFTQFKKVTATYLAFNLFVCP